MRTRTTKRAATTKNAAVSANNDDEDSTPTIVRDTNPPMIMILPHNTSSDARILTLRNPATGVPCRYLACPEQGVFEFTTVSSSKSSPASWLLAPSGDMSQPGETRTETQPVATADLSRGYCIEPPNLFVATPVDPMFLLLPILTPAPADDGTEQQQMFLSLDDHIDAWTAWHTPTVTVSPFSSDEMREKLIRRLRTSCDTVDAGDEVMFRLSEPRLAKELLSIAQRTLENGPLPASMERCLVQEALRAPSTMTMNVAEVEAIDANAADAADTAGEGSDSKQIHDLLRLRTVLSFMLDSYIEPRLRERIWSHFSGPDRVFDFSILEAHLAKLESLRVQAHALRSISDNISRKRSHGLDEEAEEVRAEKRRKKEEEELRKKNQSRASKQLAKTNTSGMKKMSSFFAKKPVDKTTS